MSDDEDSERIARRLARAGIASRRVAETMIAAGRVAVNGRIIDSPALNVTARDKVTLDGHLVAEAEPTRLWRYYKPIGLVTSERDESGRDTVFAALPEELPRVMSIGRLDLNSEGLLLLTNDGALKRRLELPSTGWLRKYRVRVHGAPDDAMLEPLRKRDHRGRRALPADDGDDRPPAGVERLADGVAARGAQPRGAPRPRCGGADGQPADPGCLRTVPARGAYPGGVEEVRQKALREQLGLPQPAPRVPAAPAARKRRS